MYTTLKKWPTTGTFVRIWCYNNILWSDSFKWDNRNLTVYSAEADNFIAMDYHIFKSLPYNKGVTNVRYIIQGED